jgi:thioredoxin reductase
MSTDTAVAIIGAGPYGLSVAAHLRSAGIEHRIFGSPMQSWISGMPEGMFLKSYGFASNLYEPSGSFTLAQYCTEASIPYSPEKEAIALSSFISYGLAFQDRFVPELEVQFVRAITPASSGWRIVLGSGEDLTAQKVVVAIGIRDFGQVPPVLDGLPESLVTHSSRHSSLVEFDGRSVAVIGGGSSALDLAGLLHERGVEVELFCRSPKVIVHDPTTYPRPIASRLRHPQSPMGPGWRSRLSADGAPLYRFLPESFRLEFLDKHLGPAGGWFIRDQVVGKVPIHLSSTIDRASVEGERVRLGVVDGDGLRNQFVCDHVIAATGYKVDLARLDFLGPEIRAQIDLVDGYPAVSSNFESSIPGLYFAGVTTASSFGPLVRFACGAKLTSRRISKHLRRARNVAARATRDDVGLAPENP